MSVFILNDPRSLSHSIKQLLWQPAPDYCLALLGAVSSCCHRYTTGARGRAVQTSADGSLCATWPGGDIAVTVDADYSAPLPAPSPVRPAAALTSPLPPAYRLLALYRGSGNVAASWGAGGGFVQYPNGSLCLNYSTERSSGGWAGTISIPNAGRAGCLTTQARADNTWQGRRARCMTTTADCWRSATMPAVQSSQESVV